MWNEEGKGYQASVEWEMFCNPKIERCKALVSGRQLIGCGETECEKMESFEFVTRRSFDPSDHEDVKFYFVL